MSNNSYPHTDDKLRMSVGSYEKCDACGALISIDNVYICDLCEKMLCEPCKNRLARESTEVNFSYHYCNRVPGNLLLLYNKKVLE